MAKKTTAKKKSTKSSTKKKSIQKSVKAKSTTGKNVGKKFSAKKTKLIKDINLLLDELNEENLSFLVDQCGVMYNNQKLPSSYRYLPFRVSYESGWRFRIRPYPALPGPVS